MHPQEGPEIIERRALDQDRLVMLLEDGSLILQGSDDGILAHLNAASAVILLDVLYFHRNMLQRLSQAHTDQAHEDREAEIHKATVKDWRARSKASEGDQEPPEKLDPGLGTR
jgi:hypothetical protein